MFWKQGSPPTSGKVFNIHKCFPPEYNKPLFPSWGNLSPGDESPFWTLLGEWDEQLRALRARVANGKTSVGWSPWFLTEKHAPVVVVVFEFGKIHRSPTCLKLLVFVFGFVSDIFLWPQVSSIPVSSGPRMWWSALAAMGLRDLVGLRGHEGCNGLKHVKPTTVKLREWTPIFSILASLMWITGTTVLRCTHICIHQIFQTWSQSRMTKKITLWPGMWIAVAQGLNPMTFGPDPCIFAAVGVQKLAKVPFDIDKDH